jgi:hypothetical protein
MYSIYDKSKLNAAIKLAGEAHADDKWGDYPYMVHLALVAYELRELEPGNIQLECAGWLHDVIEDHPEYAERIAAEFPELYPSLLIDSRNPDDSYDDYLISVINSLDSTAIKVKWADMKVNMGNQDPNNIWGRYRRNFPKLERALAALYQ